MAWYQHVRLYCDVMSQSVWKKFYLRTRSTGTLFLTVAMWTIFKILLIWISVKMCRSLFYMSCTSGRSYIFAFHNVVAVCPRIKFITWFQLPPPLPPHKFCLILSFQSHICNISCHFLGFEKLASFDITTSTTIGHDMHYINVAFVGNGVNPKMCTCVVWDNKRLLLCDHPLKTSHFTQSLQELWVCQFQHEFL